MNLKNLDLEFFMREEKEIKFVIKVEPKIIDKLIKQAGFFLLTVIDVSDTYYDYPDFRMLKNKEAFRVREVDGTKQYSYKKKGTKVYEDKLDEKLFNETVKDMKPLITLNKKRSVYKLGDNEIVIDRIKELGNFLEVECEKNNPQDVFNTLKIPVAVVERTTQGITDFYFKNRKQARTKNKARRKENRK
ncbi:CYTH domain-containing protein [Patescibacteria group bacterium]|nr:CYTH domain-containing protein [Patescibacteria group bacterium]